MIAIYIIGGILAFLALIVVLIITLKIHIVVAYDAKKNLRLYVRFLFIKYNIDLNDLSGEKKIRTKTDFEEPRPEIKKGGDKPDIKGTIDYVLWVLKFIVKRVAPNLTIKLKRFGLTIATDDAARTALIFGGVSAAYINLISFLDRNVDLVISKKVEGVNCDFTTNEPTFEIKIDFILNVLKAIQYYLQI